jgi:uncharacterized protein YbjT (DUF2867 family)
VIITASSTNLKGFKENPNYFSQGTRYAIDAMKAADVRRLVVLSAYGAGDTYAPAPFFMRRILIPFLLKVPYADHDRQEQLVRESGLDWVVARPTRLTDGPALKQYIKKSNLERVPLAISRADVADFLVEAAETNAWTGQCVSLGG